MIHNTSISTCRHASLRAIALATATICPVLAATPAQSPPAPALPAEPSPSPFVKSSRVAITTPVDKLWLADWKRHSIPVPLEASDAVLLRRACLDIAGRLPTPEETLAYLADTSPQKFERLVDSLLASPGFVDLWTMRFLDILRVKSEFPINLWPNAVYAYERRIREFVRTGEPYDRFARALLTSEGSNFRSPEANFFRAIPVKTADGVASAVALTWMGLRAESMPRETFQSIRKFFEGYQLKPTREWKEEIVFFVRPDRSAKYQLPGGKGISLPPGTDPRAAFCDDLVAPQNPYFARAMVERAMFWLFGQSFHTQPDDLANQDGLVNDALASHLATRFAREGYNLRKLVRMIATSAAYRASSLPDPLAPQAAGRHFATYKIRRLPAEVLDDMLRDITGSSREFTSVIPEPFTVVPSDTRTVTLADGSITSPFLLLFGRPPRDSGLVTERQDILTAKQRQYLINSAELNRDLTRYGRAQRLSPQDDSLTRYYLAFLCRPPTRDESSSVQRSLFAPRKERGATSPGADLAWALVNSFEFLHQH